LSTLRAVQLLEVSTLQGPELSLDVSTLQWLVLLLDRIREIVSTAARWPNSGPLDSKMAQ
jgi:hypothetical protein